MTPRGWGVILGLLLGVLVGFTPARGSEAVVRDETRPEPTERVIVGHGVVCRGTGDIHCEVDPAILQCQRDLTALLREVRSYLPWVRDDVHMRTLELCDARCQAYRTIQRLDDERDLKRRYEEILDSCQR